MKEKLSIILSASTLLLTALLAVNGIAYLNECLIPNIDSYGATVLALCEVVGITYLAMFGCLVRGLDKKN